MCDLVRGVLTERSTGETAATAIPLKHDAQGSTRYTNSDISWPVLRGLLDDCHDAEWLVLAVGEFRGKASTISATERFASMVEARGISLADFDRQPGAELIVLNRKTKEEMREGANARPREWNETVEYTDTRITREMRGEMERLNAFLAGRDIAMAQADGSEPRQVASRRLCRYFSLLPGQPKPRFDQGGRLFGAAWSNLERSQRRQFLRIDGEPIAECDYSAMFTRLAYAGQQMDLSSDADPYAIPGFEEHRQGLKMALNALLFTGGGLSRWPHDVAPEMPKGFNVARTKAAILKQLPGLATGFGACASDNVPIGFSLMFTESRVLMEVLKRLMDAGVTALPLHDAVLVAESKAAMVIETMEIAARDVIGVRVPVVCKRFT